MASAVGYKQHEAVVLWVCIWEYTAYSNCDVPTFRPTLQLTSNNAYDIFRVKYI